MDENEKPLGPTGEFPQGKIAPHDEGEIRLKIFHNDENVVIEFGTPVSWVAMPKSQGLTLAFALLEHCGVNIQHQVMQPPANGEPV